MKQILFVPAIFMVILLFSCKEKKEVSIPSDIIQPDSMVSVLIDFHLVEAAIAETQRTQKNVNFATAYYYRWVYEKHKITRGQFAESVLFYSKNTSVLMEIYTKIVDDLSTQDAKISAEESP